MEQALTQDDGDEPGETDDWSVELLIDRKGTGECAYTYGLTGYGLPELYVPGTPEEGADPDGRMDLAQRARILAAVGHRLVEDELDEAEPMREPVGDGVVLRYRLGTEHRPTGPLAIALPHCRSVVPVLWSLETTPHGSPEPLGSDKQDD